MQHTKDYLKQYKRTILRIQQLERELAVAEETLDCIGSTTGDGMPRGTLIASQTEILAIKLATIREKLMAKKVKAVEARDYVFDLIESIADPAEAAVLYARYIELKEWDAIANEVHYSRYWTQCIHGNALVSAKEVLEERSEIWAME